MRVVRITGPRFAASRRFHAPPGSPEDRAIARVLRDLADEERPLPGPDDHDVIVPPSLRCLGRAIPSAGLVVCYFVTTNGVTLVAVKRS